MNLSTMTAVSPVDGRYRNKTKFLAPYFSEYGLIYFRLMVEIKWLQSLSENPKIKELPQFSEDANSYLLQLLELFNENEAQTVKDFEKKTNHDVKAIEYYLSSKLKKHKELKEYVGFIHFACTSEDINNVAYALMMKEAIANVVLPAIAETVGSITLLGKQYAKVPMLSRTHGQPASPTTIGKELINFVARLKRPQQQLTEVLLSAKFNGAVGNYNAHCSAYPEVNWREHCENFISSLNLSFNPYTTQIEPHDTIAEVGQIIIRINNILLDYARDIWSYISLGFFKQKTVKGEVGSSTMPHKVNPIDFENAEGNLGLSNAIFEHLAAKLPQSRMQRDLSDSTVMRNIGVAFAYSIIAYNSLSRGNNKLQINKNILKEELTENWEVLGEAIQTVMRRYNIANAYEQLRDLTRGNKITKENLHDFIKDLVIPEKAKKELLKLTPEKYLGQAVELVKAFS